MERVLQGESLTAGSYKIWIDKTAIRLWDLRGQTSQFSKRRAPNCTSKTLRTETQRSRWLFQVKCYERYSKGPHIVRLRALPGSDQRLSRRDIVVSCSCPFWTYWGPDYNAVSGGYSEAIRSNGSAPNVRDPSRRNLICKHVWIVGRAVREWIVPEPKKPKPMYETQPAEPEFEEPRRPTVQDEPEEEETPPEQTKPEKIKKPVKPIKTPPVTEEVEEEEDDDFPVYLL